MSKSIYICIAFDIEGNLKKPTFMCKTIISNAVTSTDVIAQFKGIAPAEYSRLVDCFELRVVSGLVYFVRADRLSVVRNLFVDIKHCYCKQLCERNFHNAWVVNEILDTILFTFR